MKKNMVEKNVVYKYLVSDQPNVKKKLQKLVTTLDLGELQDRFQYRFAPSHVIESDVTIIDPNTFHENAFILAPCESPYYHFNIIGSHLHRVKNRFEELWDDAE